MDYKALLSHSYKMELDDECAPRCRLEYLSRSIFEFVTYDQSMDELFARKAVEVCAAITSRTTFEYIQDEKNYEWYLIMCNLPFFSTRIEWGSSIRGAWWVSTYLSSCGLWMGDDQIIGEIPFTIQEWEEFIRAIIEFSNS